MSNYNTHGQQPFQPPQIQQQPPPTNYLAIIIVGLLLIPMIAVVAACGGCLMLLPSGQQIEEARARAAAKQERLDSEFANRPRPDNAERSRRAEVFGQLIAARTITEMPFAGSSHVEVSIWQKKWAQLTLDEKRALCKLSVQTAIDSSSAYLPAGWTVRIKDPGTGKIFERMLTEQL